jgi:hypothetical protein
MGEFVIWSHERRAFWGPDEGGYASTLIDAGRYDRGAVDRILAETWCTGCVRCDGGRVPHETALLVVGSSPPAPSGVPDVR